MPAFGYAGYTVFEKGQAHVAEAGPGSERTEPEFVG